MADAKQDLGDGAAVEEKIKPASPPHVHGTRRRVRIAFDSPRNSSFDSSESSFCGPPPPIDSIPLGDQLTGPEVGSPGALASCNNSFFLDPPSPAAMASPRSLRRGGSVHTPSSRHPRMTRRLTSPTKSKSEDPVDKMQSGQKGHKHAHSCNPLTPGGEQHYGARASSELETGSNSQRTENNPNPVDPRALLRDVVVQMHESQDDPSPRTKHRNEGTYKRRESTIPEIFDEETLNRIVRKILQTVGVSAQYYKFRKYKDTISGSQIIDFMLEHRIIDFEERAIMLGSLMMFYRILTPAYGKEKFHMSRTMLYRFDKDSKKSRLKHENDLLSRWCSFASANKLAQKMLNELPQRSFVSKFKRYKGVYSGHAIMEYLKNSDECPECQTYENASVLGGILLLHNLIMEAGTKESSYRLTSSKFYYNVNDMVEMSLMDNPLLSSYSDRHSISSLKLLDAKNTTGESQQQMEGWLERKSKLGFWKKRYVRLKLRDVNFGSHLGYWTNDNPDSRAKGSIPLTQIRSVVIKDRHLTLKMSRKHKGKSLYLFRAKDDQEAEKWGGALQPFVKASTIEEILELSALAIFLHQNHMDALGKMMKFKRFPAHSRIYNCGSKANMFYLLHSGKIGIYIGCQKRGEEEKLLTEQTPVSFFGEEMFTDGSLYGSSIRAETEVACVVLDKKKWKTFSEKYPWAGGQLLNFMGRGVIDMLKKVEFLSTMSDERLDVLRRGVHCTAFKRDQIVFYEGDEGDELYLILKGSVKVQRRNVDTGKEVEVVTLQQGSYFGEMALIMNIGRTASVLVLEPSLLLSINKRTFESFLEMAGLDFKQVTRTRVIETFKRFKIPFFQAISDERFHEIAHVCQIEKYEKGQVIFNEGDPGDRFYIISYGQVEVQKDGKSICKLGVGTYFGEVALVVEDTMRTATCVATLQSVLLSMSAEDFQRFFESNPKALADVELKLAGKNAGIRAILHHPLALEEFTEFLKSQCAAEHINCWKDLTKFRQEFSSIVIGRKGQNIEFDEDELWKLHHEANRIVDHYIRVESDEEVNIPDQMRKTAVKLVEESKITEDVFFAIETEIVRLLRDDKLGSFRRTPGFITILQSVGNYGDMVTDQDMKKRIVKSSSSLTRRSSILQRNQNRILISTALPTIEDLEEEPENTEQRRTSSLKDRTTRKIVRHIRSRSASRSRSTVRDFANMNLSPRSAGSRSPSHKRNSTTPPVLNTRMGAVSDLHSASLGHLLSPRSPTSTALD
mmetsp:Transcript_4981/g.9177  ORF Transcript_4981/g.9177 Transcript_4981/m.9177 type:complete len:1244 (-) Transcript_4981:131-3862(-)|eukprot:CAMPEP_0197523736 /NCGR_PEP_ID=MMETSP1318-20131121/8606_1 /TAXON_ID=552666 /ORGANISM="Partenskyella glossopodia, Strain RCC365" /LENGTH=1243 /DNA_ID=CAMNT_0043076525 /DNA_START=206 /DNA_END=3937 /DNA_ORIENTATION=+